LKTLGKLLINLKEYVEYAFQWVKKNWKISTYNRLNLETLGPQLVLHKFF
jgi:hypothetical protein